MNATETNPKPSSKQAKATGKGRVTQRRADSAPAKGKGTKKASPVKKAPKSDSKTNQVLELLKRANGASTEELLSVTGWQAHSLRGFLAGTIRKKMGLALASAKGEDGVRRYTIES
jgi:hypothetical protein